MQLGKTNTMQCVKRVDFGIYLDGEEFGEVLMPAKYVPEDCQVEDWITGFLYLDSTGRPVVTTLVPKAEVGEMAVMEVKQVTSVGAFLEWGIAKDLLLPFSEQKRDVEVGEQVMVYVYLDEKSNRIVATQKFDRFMGREALPYAVGDKVSLTIVSESELGYRAVIENQWLGLLYKNEVFVSLSVGSVVEGYIKTLRPDGKIDLSLQPAGYGRVSSESERILRKLIAAGGFLPTTDKSDPQLIYATYGISKKTYKKAVGDLYKQRKVTLSEQGISLVK